jgi:hypothetical protein
MVSVNGKISKISMYLQTLTTKEYSSQVEEAVDKQDKKALTKVCKDAKIPTLYIPSITAVIMSVGPQKWPDEA